MTENELRQKVADTINAWVGATRGSATHREILNIYNTHTPLARGYKVQVNDAHCATTASAAYIKAGIADYTGTECSCTYFMEEAKKRGIWVESDAHTPGIGDSVLYDWQDDGKGDNTGLPDHIGIVTALGAGTFTVTEGNMNGGRVGKRNMAVNGKYIRGFICPPFAEIAKKMGGGSAAETPTTQQTATPLLYAVAAGDTLSKIAAAHGTTVADLVRINGIKNPNVIRVGQVMDLTDAAAAIRRLAKLGVINSPDYWRTAVASGKVKYLDLLLVKAAEKITKAGTRSSTVPNAVGALVRAGVINSPDYWLAHQSDYGSLPALLCALGGAVK